MKKGARVSDKLVSPDLHGLLVATRLNCIIVVVFYVIHNRPSI